MLSQRTINYAIPPKNHYWQWTEERDAIEWADDRTLALWPEVHSIIARLGTDGGLPPLGSLLLVLAACREDWLSQRPANHNIFRNILDISQSNPIPLDVAEVVITGLDQIHQLPPELRTSLSAKCLLISALFEGGPHCLLKKETELVLRDLSVIGLRVDFHQTSAMNAKARFFRDIRALKTGLARHNSESLASLLRTGLENPKLLPPELPQQPIAPDDSRDLWQQLEASGGELAAVAATAKRTIAMLNFPGRFGSPRDLQVGGIADITNRGTIDRLLPGELAWDDLVLAARLVHNEALYFRREIPPADVAVSQTILLDRGIRLWGTMRVFSIGVALGLRHHPALQDQNETFEVVAANHDAFEYIDLSNTRGISKALEPLIPSPDPTKFLATWWDAAQIVDDPSIPELTLITAREHLEHDATRRIIGEISAWIQARNGRFRIITLGRQGEMEMHAWSPAGNNLLCRGELDVNALLGLTSQTFCPPPLPEKPNPLHAILPIYGEARLPFLFPLTPQFGSFLASVDDRSGFGIADRRLMHWPQAGWGATELHYGLSGRSHWISEDSDRKMIVIATGEQPGDRVRVFRWNHEKLIEIKIEESRHTYPRYATVSGNAVLLAYSDFIEALSLKDGSRLTEKRISSFPNAPILHFDGKDISVSSSDQTVAPLSEKWSKWDDRPHLISPSQISWSQGVLLALVGNDCLELDPNKLLWKKSKAGFAKFKNFETTSFSPCPGVILKKAIGQSPQEIWLDPRGILHLRDSSFRDDCPCWSILLSSPATSIWSKSTQLSALDPRLRLPSCEAPSSSLLEHFKAFLSSSSKP